MCLIMRNDAGASEAALKEGAVLGVEVLIQGRRIRLKGVVRWTVDEDIVLTVGLKVAEEAMAHVLVAIDRRKLNVAMQPVQASWR